MIRLACLLLLVASSAWATSRIYKSLRTLAVESDIVAIVKVSTKPEEDRLKLPRSTSYRSATSVAVIDLLKGSAPLGFLVHHGSALDDVLFQNGSGTYLIFLNEKDGLYVPLDGWPSAKLLRGGSVTGWRDDHGFTAPLISVELVKKEIQGWLAEAGEASPPPSSGD